MISILVVNNYGTITSGRCRYFRKTDYSVGPLLYKNLGYNNATQLLYGAAWLTFALGLNGTIVLKAIEIICN